MGSRFGIYKSREVESMEYIDNDDESLKLSCAEVMCDLFNSSLEINMKLSFIEKISKRASKLKLPSNCDLEFMSVNDNSRLELLGRPYTVGRGFTFACGCSVGSGFCIG